MARYSYLSVIILSMFSAQVTTTCQHLPPPFFSVYSEPKPNKCASISKPKHDMRHSLYFNKSLSVYPTEKKEAVTGKKGGGREGKRRERESG